MDAKKVAGFSEEELATMPTVYEPGCLAGQRFMISGDGVKRHLGVEIGIRPMTIRDPAAVEALFLQAEEEMGGIDVLVNNGRAVSRQRPRRLAQGLERRRETQPRLRLSSH